MLITAAASECHLRQVTTVCHDDGGDDDEGDGDGVFFYFKFYYLF